MDIDSLTFGPDGLIPGIVQDRAGAVRMVAWLNRDALLRTLDTGFVTFWSRSRQALWTKGETSGKAPAATGAPKPASIPAWRAHPAWPPGLPPCPGWGGWKPC